MIAAVARRAMSAADVARGARRAPRATWVAPAARPSARFKGIWRSQRQRAVTLWTPQARLQKDMASGHGLPSTRRGWARPRCGGRGERRDSAFLHVRQFAAFRVVLWRRHGRLHARTQPARAFRPALGAHAKCARVGRSTCQCRARASRRRSARRWRLAGEHVRLVVARVRTSVHARQRLACCDAALNIEQRAFRACGHAEPRAGLSRSKTMCLTVLVGSSAPPACISLYTARSLQEATSATWLQPQPLNIQRSRLGAQQLYQYRPG